MKKFILHIIIFFFLLTPILSFSQYDSLIVENKLWSLVEYQYNWWGDLQSLHTTYYKFEGDTSFDNQSYKILYSSWKDSTMQYMSIESFYREDSLKVYEYRRGMEILRYDFSLEKGDSICPSIYPDDPCYNWQYVDSVDTILIFGAMRKRIIFKIPLEDIWIEGIGSLYHPFFPIIPFLNYGWDLSCCLEDDILIYKSEYFDNCHVEYVNGIISKSLVTDIIEIFPNPFVDYAIIQLKDPNPINIKTIQILNSNGKKIQDLKLIHNSIRLERGNLPSGLYFIQIIDNNSRFYISKLIAL